MRKHDLNVQNSLLDPQRRAEYDDCLVVCTHHRAYDWRMIAQHAKLIIDTRGVMRGLPCRPGQVVFA